MTHSFLAKLIPVLHTVCKRGLSFSIIISCNNLRVNTNVATSSPVKKYKQHQNPYRINDVPN